MNNQGKVCPKCGYARTGQEDVPETQCPSCGIIYAKIEKRMQQEAEAAQLVDDDNARSFATVDLSILARYKLRIIVVVVCAGLWWLLSSPDSEEGPGITVAPATEDAVQAGTDAPPARVEIEFTPELRGILSQFRSDAGSYGLEVTEDDMKDEMYNGRNQVRWLGYIAPDGPVPRREVESLSDEEKKQRHKVKCLSGGDWKYLGKLPGSNDYSQCWVATEVTEKLKNSQPHLFIVIGNVTSVKWVSYQWDSKSNAWVTYTRDEKLQNARWMLEKESYRLPEFFDTQIQRQEKSQERNSERNQKELDRLVEALQSAQSSEDANEIKWKTRNLKMQLIKPYRAQIQRAAATAHLNKIDQMLGEGKIYNRTRNRFE